MYWTGHYNEPPHQDLRCLQIQLFASLVLKHVTKLMVSDVCLRILQVIHPYIYNKIWPNKRK